MLVPIRRVEYHCDDGGAGAGTCAFPDGGRPEWQHFFERNAPLFDQRTLEVAGPVLVKAKGIHDWPGGTAPASDGRAARRLGRLIAFDLADGQPVYFGVGKYGLFTDTTGTRLLVVRENPVNLLSSLPPVENPAHFAKLRGMPEIQAVAFILPGCELCEQAAPAIIGLRNHFGGMWALDGKRLADLAMGEGVRAAPTVVLYRAGAKVATITRIEDVARKLDACAMKVIRAKKKR